MTSVWDGLRGHAEVREAFRRARARGRLSQAYLFLGPDGIGKLSFARRLAQVLLCQHADAETLDACGDCTGCRPFLADSHPDFHVVEREPGKRELTVARFIGERDQRGKAGLCHDLSLRPLPGSRKVAVINDADTMNEEAANALLKTLEEPPEGAVLLLIAANLDAILPTIRSRCQLVRFAPLPDADVAALLLEQGLASTADEARLVSQLAEGSLTAARQLLSPQLRSLRQTLFDELAQPQFSGVETARKLSEGLEQLGGDTAELRVAAVWLIRTTLEFYRAALWRLSTGSDAALFELPQATRWAERWRESPEWALELLGDLIERCTQAAGEIEQNVTVPLCLEALYSDLSGRLQPTTR